MMAHESGIVKWERNSSSMLNSSYTVQHLIQHLENTLLPSLKKFPTTPITHKANQREVDLFQDSCFVRTVEVGIPKKKKKKRAKKGPPAKETLISNGAAVKQSRRP
jgi:hypothetical protein